MKGLVYLGSSRAKHERVSSRPVIGSHLHAHYTGKHREGYLSGEAVFREGI